MCLCEWTVCTNDNSLPPQWPLASAISTWSLPRQAVGPCSGLSGLEEEDADSGRLKPSPHGSVLHRGWAAVLVRSLTLVIAGSDRGFIGGGLPLRGSIPTLSDVCHTLGHPGSHTLH